MISIVTPMAMPRRLIVMRRVSPDVIGVLVLLVLTTVGTLPLWYGGTVIGTDLATQFYPWYAALGERLRAWDIPGWNPAQFSGTPFAADLLSGWMYLPAMIIFAALPPATAIKAFLVFGFLLAGLSMYAFARVLGISLLGGLMAAVAYEFSGFAFAMSACCPTFNQGSAWLPLTLLGIELAIRGRVRLTTIAWWGVTSFALSQILAVWVNQRAYYALLVIGSYVIYRTLISSPMPAPSWRGRLAGLSLHGGFPLLFGISLAMAGILPRLEYHQRSNLSHGYDGIAAELGGWTLSDLVGGLLARADNMYYAGFVVVALTLYAARIVRRSVAIAYFGALAVTVLILTLSQTTPVHQLLYLLPGFENLHRHFPERIIIIYYLGAALLAGTAVSELKRWKAVPVLLIVLAVVDLLTAAPFALMAGGQRLEPDDYFATTGAAAFLQRQQVDGPFRFFGYDSVLGEIEDGELRMYLYHWPDANANALLVNNRATLYGLQDLQGYNPIQPARYAEYVTALNGHAQEYRATNIFAGGLGSPLLDLLNSRYTVLPAAVAPSRPDLLHLSQQWPTVYQDETVRVLENPDALPRAWLVHEARQVERDLTLGLLASGVVDPRQTALLEAPLPVLGKPVEPANDEVVVTSYEPDRMQLRTRSDAAGLLMLSESYDPNWHAYVDGERVDLFVADHALRAVPVPAGEHTVELRYESATLRNGLVISAGTYSLLGGLWLAAGWARLRRQRPGPLTD